MKHQGKCSSIILSITEFLYDNVGYITIIVLAIIIYLVCYTFSEKCTDGEIGIFGTIISLLAFLFTIFQLKVVNDLTIDTKNKVTSSVNESKEQIKNILYISEFTTANKTIDEIIAYLHGNKFDTAAIRMRDVLKILNKIQVNKELKTHCSSINNDIDEIIMEFGLNINNLLSNNAVTCVLTTNLYANLYQVNIIINSVEEFYKNKSYDTKQL